MRIPVSAVCLFLAAAGLSRADESDALRAMTFNIRYDNPGDGPNQWRFRRDGLAELIRDQNVDILGCQEALRNQIADLEERLPGYAWYGVGRDDGRERGEFVPIFYRKDRFDVLEKSSFWLSESPDQPGSRSWDAALPRVTTYMRLRDKETGAVWSVFNTHFDHRGRLARVESARLLREKVSEVPKSDRVLLLGDFNCQPSDRPYQVLTAESEESRRLSDARTASQTDPRGPDSTWNGFTMIIPGRRIDFIFVSGNVRVLSHEILEARMGERFLSDHLPVVVDVTSEREPD